MLYPAIAPSPLLQTHTKAVNMNINTSLFGEQAEILQILLKLDHYWIGSMLDEQKIN